MAETACAGAGRQDPMSRSGGSGRSAGERAAGRFGERTMPQVLPCLCFDGFLLVFKKKMPNFAGGIVALRGCNVIILR